MPMPVAAMDQADSGVLRQDEVRLAGQGSNMEAIANSRRVERAAECQFGTGVLVSYPGHHSRTSLRGNNVRHQFAVARGVGTAVSHRALTDTMDRFGRMSISLLAAGHPGSLAPPSGRVRERVAEVLP